MHSTIRPVTVIALPKICTAFYNWKSEVVYLNTTRVFMYVCSYSVYVSSCIKKSIANRRISSQESKQISSKTLNNPGKGKYRISLVYSCVECYYCTETLG